MPTGPSDIFEIEDPYERCRAYLDYFKEHGFEPSKSLSSMLKEIYTDQIADLIPDGTKLFNKLKFINKDKQSGNLYHQPVVIGKFDDEE